MFKRAKKTTIRDSWDDKLLYFVSDLILLFVLIIVAYPIIYVISCSLSSGHAVAAGRVVLWPVDFSLQGYQIVFSYKSVWTGFYNTFIYTFFGTVVNMILSVLAAYPLSRPEYQGRKWIMMLFTGTMMFGAGMVPTYIMYAKLNLTNTRLIMIISGAISTYNMIIIRTYFRSSIPQELIDAAKVDGCSDFRTLANIVLPLSKAVLSVVTLYYAVGHWNAYFNALIYLRKPQLQPLQLVLRSILAASSIDLTQVEDAELVAAMTGAADLVKYAMIVVTSVPVIVMYPLVQKYFEKGVMIGSVKG